MPASNDNQPLEAPSVYANQVLTPDQQKRRLYELCETLPSDESEDAGRRIDPSVSDIILHPSRKSRTEDQCGVT